MDRFKEEFPKLNPQQISFLKEQGYKKKEIATEWGVSKKTVWDWENPSPKTGPKKKIGREPKIDGELIPELFNLWKGKNKGFSQQELASYLSVKMGKKISRYTVWRALEKYSDKKCEYCNNLLTKEKAKNPITKYCSSNCARENSKRIIREQCKLRQIRMREEHPERFTCKMCSQVIPYGGKYKAVCSEGCKKKRIKQLHGEYRKEFMRAKTGSKPRDPTWNICAICNKELPPKRRILRIRTCSKQCATENTLRSLRKASKKQCQEIKRKNTRVRCVECSKIFKKKSGILQYTCSLECKRKRISKRNVEWQKRNKEKHAKTSRESYRKLHPPQIIKCKGCEKKFRKKGYDKYCSKKCHWKHYSPIKKELDRVRQRERYQERKHELLQQQTIN